MARKITATKCPPQKCNFYTFLLFYCRENILQNSRYSAVEVASLNYLRYVYLYIPCSCTPLSKNCQRSGFS